MHGPLTTRAKQVVAGVLALSAAFVGGWAEFAPRSFYRSFPLPGHHWVSPLGPYNEHLVRDVGALCLALVVVSVWAAARPQAELHALAGCAWLVFGVAHPIFHLSHLGMFDTADKIGNVGALGGTVVLAALLLVPAPDRTRFVDERT